MLFGVYPSDEPRRLNAKAQRMAGLRAFLYQRSGRGGPFIAFFAMSGDTRVIVR